MACEREAKVLTAESNQPVRTLAEIFAALDEVGVPEDFLTPEERKQEQTQSRSERRSRSVSSGR